MKAVILAAGNSRRMLPLTKTKPKAMLPVAGKPILEHLVGEVAAAGIREFVFIIGGYGERIKEHFGGGESLGVSIEYRVQERATGTAAAISMARDTISGPFLVACGDGIVTCADISRLMGSDDNQVGVQEVDDPEHFGWVELEGEVVRHIHEKLPHPPAKSVSTGLYLFTPEIFETVSAVPLSERGEYELPAAVNLLINRGVCVRCCRFSSWREMSYPWDLLAVNEALMANLVSLTEGVVEEGVVINGAVRIGAGSLLRSGTYIEGPVVIGKNCELGPNCYVRAATVIGDGCRIGAGVEVKNSLIMDGTKVPHLSYIGDSLIGERCNLGAGTKVANLRLDGWEIKVRGISTGRRKFGVVVGDGVQTGINTCLNPGVVIGAGAWIGPGALVCGEIAQDSRVFRSR